MHDRFKRPWMEKLRSGEYDQVRGKLRGNDVERGIRDGFCCVGLLCETYIDLTGRGSWSEPFSATKDDREGGHERRHFLLEKKNQGARLVRQTREEVGITNDQVSNLIRMNDKEGKSFAEIADWIEVNL